MSGAPPVVWFHIGVPKTGTTFLQRVMHRHRAQLKQDGLLYPGTSPSHFWASQDLRESGFRGHHDPHVPGSWKRTVDEVRAFGGPAVISHESFGQAGAERIDQALADLSFAEVHVVVTARDLARQLPATWQERIKNRSSETWAEFLASIRSGRTKDGPARSFWVTHGLPKLLGRWSRDVPADRVHIVTVPAPGSDSGLLWTRFAGLVGVDPLRYDTSGAMQNTSLGGPEAALLREYNASLADRDGPELPWPAYAAAVKNTLAPRLGIGSGQRIELPPDAYDWAVEWSRSAVEQFTTAGYDIVGDLAELVPSERPLGVDPDHVPDDLRARVALSAMVELTDLAMAGPVAAAAMRRSQRGSFARKAEEISRRSDTVGRVRDAYRKLRE